MIRLALRLGLAAGFLLSFLALFSASAAQDKTYRLQPEDILRVQVYNEPQIDAQLPIGEDGNISAPFIGLIRAEGKTTAELEAELVKEYVAKLRLRDPKVAVTVLRFREHRASAGGMVTRAGAYVFRPGDTIMTLINYAGGPLVDRADMRRATLRRFKTSELIPIDLQALMVRGDTSQNYELSDGDELIIPEETRNRILLLGAIAAPGTYGYKEGMRLQDAISLGRGEVPNRSMLSQVYVFRETPGVPGKYLRLRVNFVNYLKKGDNTQNIVLEPGDLVYVTNTKTPLLSEISGIVNTAFFLDRVFRDGVFGLGGGGGR